MSKWNRTAAGKKYFQEWQKAHQEEVSAYQSQYRQANQDRLSAYKSQWRKENAGKIKAQSQEYYALNKELLAEKRSTPEGVLKVLYYNQILSSKVRGHEPPAYSASELVDRFINDSYYLQLHAAWLFGGKQKNDKPSFDRIDTTKGYSFDNIELTTWAINQQRGWDDRKVPVVIFKDGAFVGRFSSQRDAERQLGLKFRGGQRMLRDSGRTSHGFMAFTANQNFKGA